MSLEATFRADINGWLEYESKRKSTALFTQQQKSVSDSSVDRLIESLDSTLSYYNYSAEASNALHNTVFYNVLHHQDYAIDFNVVNFPMAISHYLLYRICERFDLHKYTCHELWKMPPQEALDFILKTSSATHKSLRHVHHVFFKLVQKNVHFEDIQDQDVQTFIIKQIEFDNKDDLVSQHLPYMLQTIHDCIQENVQNSNKNPDQAAFLQKSTEKLMWFCNVIPALVIKKDARARMTQECSLLLQMTFDLSGQTCPSYLIQTPHSSNVIVPIQTCQNARVQQHSLKYDWHKLMQQQDPDTTTHEQAFLVICWHLQSKCLVLNNLYQNTADDKSGLDRLEQRLHQKIVQNDLVRCQLWCIFSIRNRASFWKSTLKVVVQFMDIWIKDIAEAKCADIFAGLIAKENMMVILYQLILKHVQHYQKAKSQDDLVVIKNLCRMLEICIDSTPVTADLVHFRDDILKQRLETGIHLPTFGSIEFWNIPFTRDLIKVCNQITAVDEDTISQHQTPKDSLVKLTKLSIVWPYQVVHELVIACVQNKNQFRAIIPILKMLGNLCFFRKSNSCSSLLMSVLQDTVTHLQESNALSSHQANIAQFIKGCLMNDLTENHPIILTPHCPDQRTRTLLNLKEIMVDFILPPLVEFTRNPATCSIQRVRFNLQVLNAFCPSHWEHVESFMVKSDLPAVLYCSSETFVHCLTFIMNLREQQEKHGVQLEDWEAALNCIDIFTVIIHYGISTMPSQFRTLQNYFETALTDFGWKSQLLWYPFIKHKPLRIPTAFYQITGSLKGLFEQENDNGKTQNNDKMEGWHQLFTACRLSTELTDTLFQRQWEYNMLLLWKHPVENDILLDGLQYALHPMSSHSVSAEYPKLLNHFLFKLYDSFDFYTVLRDEQYYADKHMLPIVSQLSKGQGTQLYFVVLCIIQLLKTQATADSNDSLYYMSCLIKVIQDVANWGNISKDGQATSYIKLKERVKAQVDETVECHLYPLLSTDKLKSDRALSVLTLYHLSLLTVDMNETRSDIVQRLVMQIVEGLVDMESRQQFERMLQQQPKKRIANWKKKSKASDTQCQQMRLRPILCEQEAELLIPVLVAQPNLLQVLGLTNDALDNNDHDRKTLYFL